MSAPRKPWRKLVDEYMWSMCDKFGVEHDITLPRNVVLMMQYYKMLAPIRDGWFEICGEQVGDHSLSHQICKAKKLWRLRHGWKR